MNVEHVSYSDLDYEFSNLRLMETDAGRFEVTVSDGAKVLATNVKEIATENGYAETWNSQCEGVIDTAFNITDSQIIEQDNGRVAVINVKLCDFSGLALKPTISIETQKQEFTKKLVIYKCTVNFHDVYSAGLLSHEDSLCEYGYDTTSDQSSPAIEVPKLYAPGASLYEASRLKLKDIKFHEQEDGRSFHLKTSFASLPFGTHSSCYHQELNVFYDHGGETKTTRLKYQRNVGSNGSAIWVLENADEVAIFDEISSYYTNAARNSRKATLYRFCEWTPESLTVNPESTTL